jgi:hypothetical protein
MVRDAVKDRLSQARIYAAGSSLVWPLFSNTFSEISVARLEIVAYCSHHYCLIKRETVMQKVAPQKVSAQCEPVGNRAPQAALGPPQTSKLVQLEAMASASSMTAAQRKLDNLAQDSPRQLALRKLAAMAQSGNNLTMQKANRADLARPQAVPGAAQGSGIVQRMITREDKEISDSTQYFIDLSNRPILYVAKGAASPVPEEYFKPSGETVSFDPYYTEDMAYMQGPIADRSKDYSGYVPAAPFGKDGNKPNDCAMYADALRLRKGTWTIFKPGVNGLDYKPRADYQPGGIDGADKDPNVSATTGEMYHMAWQGDKPSAKPWAERANHHAATVVVRDGDDQITSEANSDVQMERPEFRMYGSGPSGFYEQNAAYFTQPSGVKPYMAIAPKGT